MDWIGMEKPPRVGAEVRLLAWHKRNGLMTVQAGEIRKNRFISHWARVPQTGWISREERMPEAADADEYACVLARHAWDGVKVTGWRQIAWDRYWLEWMPCPAGPPREDEEV